MNYIATICGRFLEAGPVRSPPNTGSVGTNVGQVSAFRMDRGTPLPRKCTPLGPYRRPMREQVCTSGGAYRSHFG